MKSLIFRLSLAGAILAVAAAPALAQKPGESGGSPAADRPVAVERPTPAAGGSNSAASSGVATAVDTSAGSTSSPSASSIALPTMGFGGSRAAYREEAPQHRTQSGGSSSGQAVPRGSSGGSSGSAAGSSHPSGSSSSGSSGGTRSAAPARQAPSGNHASGTQAVPNWARPRGDRPSTDAAVQRTTPRPDGRGGFTSRYYDPFGFYYGAPYYGNYFYGGNYYSPFFYSPYTLGYGFGLGFPWMNDPWYGADDSWYGGGGGGGNYSSSQGVRDEDQGALRLKLKPRDAKVYVDGYFVGAVDSMDGAFQKLPLNGGRHHVSVKADGYQPEEFDVVITPSETVTYQGDLKRIR
jgi:hypothetical protein